jgi:hypothetical protein
MHHQGRNQIAIARAACVLAALWAGAAPAQVENDTLSRRTIPAVRIEEPPTIDGVLDDACWVNAPIAAGFTDYQLGTRGCDQTEARILYDHVAIYVAFRCHDPQPGKIVARQTKRDASISGEDYVEFELDAFHQHDALTSSMFVVNPLGTPAASVAHGRAKKTEWRGEWTAAARVDEGGWSCEMAIPWAMLSYPSTDEPITMGVNFSRYQERTRILSQWSYMTKLFYGELSGHWVGVEPPAAAFRPVLSLLPYVLVDRRSESAGLDLRCTLTPGLTAVGSANPDFSNVEGDVEGIDFSYGPRYVADRRPFFQEGSQIFWTFLEAGRLFHSGQVPDFDYGAKLYGQASAMTTIGALATRSEGERTDAVARVTHRLGETSQVWAMHVGRHEDEGDNRVDAGGFESRFGDLLLSGNWACSAGTNDTRGTTADAGLYVIVGDWILGARAFHVQPGFTAADGFVSFQDYRGWGGEVYYGREWRDRRLQRADVSFSYVTRDRYDGAAFWDANSFICDLAFMNDLELSVGVDWDVFEGSHDRLWTFEASGLFSDPYRNYGLLYQEGTLQGERYRFWGPHVRFKVGERLRAGIASQLVSYGAWGYQHILTLNWDFSPRRGTAGRLVSQDGHVNWYLACRQSGYAGPEVYVIWGDPNATQFQDRLALKLIWPL